MQTETEQCGWSVPAPCPSGFLTLCGSPGLNAGGPTSYWMLDLPSHPHLDGAVRGARHKQPCVNGVPADACDQVLVALWVLPTNAQHGAVLAGWSVKGPSTLACTAMTGSALLLSANEHSWEHAAQAGPHKPSGRDDLAHLLAAGHHTPRCYHLHCLLGGSAAQQSPHPAM